MQIGFIGAGKVGNSLGKYFVLGGLSVVGYYSQNPQSAADAAKFTDTKRFDTMKQIVEVSDVLFLTVPDGAIASVWDSLKEYDLNEKIICHCSGAMASTVFSDRKTRGAFGYSVHPFLAVADKYTSYQELSRGLFTIEGDAEHIKTMQEMIASLGNPVQEISAEQKVLYHAAACVASNFMVTITDVATDLLEVCGFSEENRMVALTPLIEGTIQNILRLGPVQALTGPIERCDVQTIEKHRAALPQDYKEVYDALAKQTIKLAKKRHPAQDDKQMEGLFQ